jgi:3-oxoacyl-[acyl-carrier-protein] synthase II
VTSTDLRPVEPATGLSEPIAITGWAPVTALGAGADSFTDAIASGENAFSDPTDQFDLELPSATASVVRGFHARDYLGRKGTTFLDRSTALGLVSSHLALQDSSLDQEQADRDRLGVVLGTTTGGVNAIVDYCRDTLEQDPPYMVKPLLFPNTVMNSAAGQVGIRLKLFGPNSTISGGRLSGLQSLRYALNLLHNGYADGVVAGAYDEFTPQTAWIDHVSRGGAPGSAPLGEGAAAFLLERSGAVRESGRAPEAEILASESRSGLPVGEDPSGTAARLADAIRRALEKSGVRADQVWAVSSAEGGDPGLDAVERDGIEAALGDGHERIRSKEQLGECNAASGALQLATVLARHRLDAGLDGRVSLVTSLDRDGGIGVVVVRGWARVGGDHG